MIVFKCFLPFPVSVNSLYGGGSRQKRFKTSTYNQWLNRCPSLPAIGIKTPCSIDYKFTMPDRKKRDLANFIKCVDDYLVSQDVISDDGWSVIREGKFSLAGIDKKTSGVIVTISSIDDTMKPCASSPRLGKA